MVCYKLLICQSPAPSLARRLHRRRLQHPRRDHPRLQHTPTTLHVIQTRLLLHGLRRLRRATLLVLLLLGADIRRGRGQLFRRTRNPIAAFHNTRPVADRRRQANRANQLRLLPSGSQRAQYNRGQIGTD